MLKIPVGFVVCPCCGMAFPLTVTTTDEAHLRAHLRLDAPVKCPTCNHAFACGSAKSYVQEELIQDGTTLDSSSRGCLDGLDNH